LEQFVVHRLPRPDKGLAPGLRPADARGQQPLIKPLPTHMLLLEFVVELLKRFFGFSFCHG
jgi:hypothetical protein